MNSNWLPTANLDRRFVLQGVVAGAFTVWTLPIVDETINRIVLGPDFGESAGTELTPDFVTGRHAWKAGDYSAGCAIVGRAYTMSVELTRPFVRDRDGNADLNGRVFVKNLTLGYQNSRRFNVRQADIDGIRSDATLAMDDVVLTERGSFRAWVNGRPEEQNVFIESPWPEPLSVPSIEWLVDYRPE